MTVEPSGTVRHRAIGTVSGTVTGGSGVTRNHCAIQLTRHSDFFDKTTQVARASSLRIICAYAAHTVQPHSNRGPTAYLHLQARLEFTGTLDRTGAVSGAQYRPAKLSVRQSRSTTHDCFIFVHHITSHAYPHLTSAAVVPSADLSYRHQAKPL